VTDRLAAWQRPFGPRLRFALARDRVVGDGTRVATEGALEERSPPQEAGAREAQRTDAAGARTPLVELEV
jgi:hypothetical protein